MSEREVSEGFRLIAMAKTLQAESGYVDQKLFLTYDDAVKRGIELLTLYPAFKIEKVYTVTEV